MIKKNFTASRKSPLKKLIRSYKKLVTYTVLLAFVTLSLYYISITYMITYMVHFLEFSLADALLIDTLSIISMMIVIPLFGYLSDKIGRKKCLLISFFISSPLLPLIIYLLNNDKFYMTLYMLILFSTLVGIIQGAANPYYTDIFPKQIRASGASISYGIGSSLSGFSPLIATFITGIFTTQAGMIILVLALCFLGIMTAYLLHDKRLEVRRNNHLQLNTSIKEQLNELPQVLPN